MDPFTIAAIIIAVLSAVLSAVLQPGPPPPPQPSTIDDFSAPTADDGRPIPVIFGKVWVTGPNVVWYGDLSHTNRKKAGQTVGYRYFLGMHLAVCAGPIDELSGIRVGDRDAWTGSVGSNQTITITNGGLFGGDDGEGGVAGDVDVLFGGPNQGPNAYLQQHPGTAIAFRGVVSLVLRGNPSLIGFGPDNAFYVGTTRYIKPWAIRVKRKPGRIWNAGTESWDLWYPDKNMVDSEANPAHIVYEVLTNGDFGMGYPASIIDEARFRAVADTLSAEGTGLGFVWKDQVSVQEFLQLVMDHINAVLRLDPVSGQFYLKLIRDDYDPASLPLLDESNILELETFQRVGWGEAVNEVTVKFRGLDGKTKSVSVQNLAAVQIQGRVVSETKDYPGIRTEALARRIAARDLRAKSAGLAAVRLRCNRAAHALGPGDCFRFSWSALGIAEMVIRVGQANGGTLTDGAVTVVGAEDVFALGEAVFAETDDEEFVTPDPVPDPATFPVPAAPSGLTATPGFQMVTWAWTRNDPDSKVELWLSRTNDRSAAVLYLDDYAGHYDQTVIGDEIWYGWIRAKDTYGNFSDWVPENATNGVAGQAENDLDVERVPGAINSSEPQAAHTFLGGPAAGDPAPPDFRALMVEDLPEGVAFGDLGATDNAVLRANGTGGGAMQGSPVIIEDDGAIHGYAAKQSVSGTSYTVQASDAGKVIVLSGAAATLTLPNSLPAGFCCTVFQGGATQITIVPGAGASLHNRQNKTKIAGQYGAVCLFVAANAGGAAEWWLAGDVG